MEIEYKISNFKIYRNASVYGKQTCTPITERALISEILPEFT